MHQIDGLHNQSPLCTTLCIYIKAHCICVDPLNPRAHSKSEFPLWPTTRLSSKVASRALSLYVLRLMHPICGWLTINLSCSSSPERGSLLLLFSGARSIAFCMPHIHKKGIYTHLLFLGHKNTPARRGSERAVYIKDYPGSTTHEIISVVEQASQPLFCTIKSAGRMGAGRDALFFPLRVSHLLRNFDAWPARSNKCACFPSHAPETKISEKFRW